MLDERFREFRRKVVRCSHDVRPPLPDCDLGVSGKELSAASEQSGGHRIYADQLQILKRPDVWIGVILESEPSINGFLYVPEGRPPLSRSDRGSDIALDLKTVLRGC